MFVIQLRADESHAVLVSVVKEAAGSTRHYVRVLLPQNLVDQTWHEQWRVDPALLDMCCEVCRRKLILQIKQGFPGLINHRGVPCWRMIPCYAISERQSYTDLKITLQIRYNSLARSPHPLALRESRSSLMSLPVRSKATQEGSVLSPKQTFSTS